MRLTPDWTLDRIERVKKLADDGWSAGQIGIDLRTSRNSVIGICRRRGIMLARSPKHDSTFVKSQGKKRNRKKAKPLMIPKPPEPDEIYSEITDLPPDQSSFACTLLELGDNQCRWPLGDPKSKKFKFCGAKKQDGIPYCPRHANIAYRPEYRRSR